VPLGPTEKDLLWRFRGYLSRDNKALLKFVRCVDWHDAGEARAACDVMSTWAPVAVDDALGLLSGEFAHPDVRAYAVRQLDQADDESLRLFLLQLVQAMKYDAAQRPGAPAPGSAGGSATTAAAHGAAGASTTTSSGGGLPSPGSSSSNSTGAGGAAAGSAGAPTRQAALELEVDAVFTAHDTLLASTPVLADAGAAADGASASEVPAEAMVRHGLAAFLVRRAARDLKLCNELFWCLLVESEDPKSGRLYFAEWRALVA
jgi:hypothetical protein